MHDLEKVIFFALLGLLSFLITSRVATRCFREKKTVMVCTGIQKVDKPSVCIEPE